ncbi:hypothetical protein DENSPDRAFT_83933 [Dentipellis sp. KUC8613]|nr:hypothetical protein DENSPDRAFT_83933 [Dentipellis sp. KUC8613]
MPLHARTPLATGASIRENGALQEPRTSARCGSLYWPAVVVSTRPAAVNAVSNSPEGNCFASGAGRASRVCTLAILRFDFPCLHGCTARRGGLIPQILGQRQRLKNDRAKPCQYTYNARCTLRVARLCAARSSTLQRSCMHATVASVCEN